MRLRDPSEGGLNYLLKIGGTSGTTVKGGDDAQNVAGGLQFSKADLEFVGPVSLVNALSAKFVVKDSADIRIAGPNDDSADIDDGFAVVPGASTPTLRAELGAFDGTLPAGETAVFTLKVYRGTSGTNAISGATIKSVRRQDHLHGGEQREFERIAAVPSPSRSRLTTRRTMWSGEAGKVVRLVMEPSTTAGEFPERGECAAGCGRGEDLHHHGRRLRDRQAGAHAGAPRRLPPTRR